jgi:hypothetical protein
MTPAFADYAQVIQRIGEIGMLGAELSLLQRSRLAQIPLR